jgi:hypothetical protein
VNPVVRALMFRVGGRHFRVETVVEKQCVAAFTQDPASNRARNHGAAARVVLSVQAVAIIAQTYFWEQLLEPVR